METGVCAWLHEHHHNEETHFFPAPETLTSTPGLMSPNIAQHRDFDTGLSALTQYASSTAPENYDGDRGVPFLPFLKLQLLTRDLAVLRRI